MLDEIRSNEERQINEDTLKILRQNFPSCFTSEGKFDFIKFQELIKKDVDTSNEGYGLNFLGKSYAKYLASLDADTLLEPDSEINKENSSQNIYISGDNFDSLKHLLNSYRGSIKCVFLDPPYNTGSDGFTYQDKFNFTVENLMEKMNMDKVEAERVLDLTGRGSASHSAWLTFMLPRLLMIRDLLTPDGIVILTIDENEHANLKLLCDDIFDERNFAGEIIWKNSSKNDQAYISIQHEYIMFYVRNKDENAGDWKEKKEGLEEIYKAYEKIVSEVGANQDEIHKRILKWFGQFPDSDPIKDSKHYAWWDEHDGVYFASDISGPNYGQYVYDVVHPVTSKVVKAPASGWRYPESTLLEKIKGDYVHFGKDETTIPKDKTYLKNTEYQSLTSIKFKDGRVASVLIEKLLGGKYFSNPKDVDLMAAIFRAIGIGDGDIVLDAFSGSATTAHSVMKINAEDGTNIKYIHLQIPEKVKEADAAYKAGFRTIDEIGQARIVASAKMIHEETGVSIDYGYRHYFIRQIENETVDKMEEFNPNDFVVSNQLSDDFGVDAILATWLCKDGYKFAEAQKIDLAGYTAYLCGRHLYLINRQFNKEAVTALVKKYMEDATFNPDHIIVFGYSFENWTISETLQRNLVILKESQKDLNINYDIRY